MRVEVASAVCAMALVVPASALAVVERNVVPGGSTTDLNCTGVPCELEHAVETVAQNGDTVTIAPGNYPVAGTLTVGAAGKQLLVRGTPGQAHPVISFGAASANGVVIDGGSTLRGVDAVENGNAGAPRAVAMVSGTMEQVVATSTAAGVGAGCGASNPTGQVVIRDSVCRNAADGHGAVLGQTNGSSGSVRVVNATLVATGPPNPSGPAGLYVSAISAGSQLTVSVSNTVASGVADVGGSGSMGGTISLTIDHSNYDTTNGNPAVPAPGSGTNQTAVPLFADSANGNFHQLAGSPTIDAGDAAAANLGSADLDGELRCMGRAPDIGADEFTATGCSVDSDGDGVPDVTDTCPAQSGPASNGGCPLPDADGDGVPDSADSCPNAAGPASSGGCPVDTDPPQTKIGKSVIQGNRATFRFSSDEAGSTFKCKLDKGKFKPCTSPKRFKHLDGGKHVFAVRATDAAGNTDATPAKQRFRVAG